jgi:hypothetical protein
VSDQVDALGSSSRTKPDSPIPAATLRRRGRVGALTKEIAGAGPDERRRWIHTPRIHLRQQLTVFCRPSNICRADRIQHVS